MEVKIFKSHFNFDLTYQKYDVLDGFIYSVNNTKNSSRISKQVTTDILYMKIYLYDIPIIRNTIRINYMNSIVSFDIDDLFKDIIEKCKYERIVILHINYDNLTWKKLIYFYMFNQKFENVLVNNIPLIIIK